MNATSAVPVAVDGGQTGIRLRVGSVAETLECEGLGWLEGDIAHMLTSRISECLSRLQDGVPQIGRMVCGLTVAPAGGAARTQLASMLGAAFGAERVDVVGDELTAHAGALRGATGVVLAVGTGIACLGVNLEAGTVRRVDGDGFLLGDAGGAFWMGSRGIEAVLRARDGRGPATALESACVARYGEQADLAVWLHSRQRAVADIARFAIDVQGAAAARDEVAAQIVDQAATELVNTATAAARDLSEWPCPVALTGRAVAEGSMLREAVARLVALAPDSLLLVEAIGDPLEGAWAIANGSLGDRYAEFLSTWQRRH